MFDSKDKRPRLALDNNVFVMMAAMDARFKEIMKIPPDMIIDVGFSFEVFKIRCLKNTNRTVESLRFGEFFGKDVKQSGQLLAVFEIYKLIKLKKIIACVPQSVLFDEIYDNHLIDYYKHPSKIHSFLTENCLSLSSLKVGNPYGDTDARLAKILIDRLVQSPDNPNNFAFKRNTNERHKDMDARIYVECAFAKCHVLTLDNHYNKVDKIYEITKQFCDEVVANGNPHHIQIVDGVYKYRPYKPIDFLNAYRNRVFDNGM